MARLGYLDSDFPVIYTGTVRGLRRNWTVELKHYTPGASGSGGSGGSTVTAEPWKVIDRPGSIMLDYGQAVETFYATVKPSQLSFEVLDPRKEIITVIREARLAGEGDEDFRVRIASNDAVFEWEGILQVRQSETVKTLRYSVPVLRLVAYCGSVLNNNAAIFLDDVSSFHRFYQNTLAFSLVPKSIKYLVEWATTNMEAAASVMPRIRMLGIGPTFDKVMKRTDAILTATNTLLQVVWLGLDNAWHVAQPWLVGKALAAGEGLEVWDYTDKDGQEADEWDEVTQEEQTDTRFVTGETDWVKEPSDLGQNLFSTIDFNRDQGVEGDGRFITLNSDQYFEWWATATNPEHYESIGGFPLTQDSRVSGLGFAMLLTPNPSPGFSIGQQRILYFPRDGAAYFDITFLWAIEDSVGAGGGLNSPAYRIVFAPFDEINDEEYWWTGSSWSTTPTDLTPATHASQPNGTNPLTYYQEQQVIDVPPPVTGELRIEWYGDPVLNGDNFLIWDFEVIFVDSSGSQTQSMNSALTLREPETLAFRQGEGLTFNRKIVDFKDSDLLGGDEYEIEVLRISSSLVRSWVPVARWISQRLADEYSDLSKMIFDWVASDDNILLRRLRGQLRHIAPPEQIVTYLGTDYFQLSSRIDILREITDADWIEQPD